MVLRERREKQREREWQLWRGEGTTPVVKEKKKREKKEEIGKRRKQSRLHRTDGRTDPATTTVREKTSTHFTLDGRPRPISSFAHSFSFFLLLSPRRRQGKVVLLLPPSTIARYSAFRWRFVTAMRWNVSCGSASLLSDCVDIMDAIADPFARSASSFLEKGSESIAKSCNIA